MAIKKISEFVSAVPSSDSKILFEQNEKGKSCTVGDVVNAFSLSYEEIMATTDLTNKVASASSVKTIEGVKKPKIIGGSSGRPSTDTFNFTLVENKLYLLVGTHRGGEGTFLTVIGTYLGDISITHIKQSPYLTLTASGLTLNLTLQYGHVWCLIELD